MMHKNLVVPQNHLSRELETPIRIMLNTHAISSHVGMFTYAKHFDKNALTSVTSHLQLADDRFGQEIAFKGPGLKDGIYLLDEMFHPDVRDLHFQHNAYNNIMFLKNNDGYMEVAIFSMPWEKKNQLSYYYNNIDILQQFVSEFKDRFNETMVQLDDDKIILPNYLLEPTPHENLFEHTINKQLSNQEMNCFYFLLRGQTRKEIAERLGVSRSSVGTYIERIMQKLGCKSRSELIDFAWQNQFLVINHR